jgi:hypothetical protein
MNNSELIQMLLTYDLDYDDCDNTIQKKIDAMNFLREKITREELDILYKSVDGCGDSWVRELVAHIFATKDGIKSLPTLINLEIRARKEHNDNDGLHSVIDELILSHPQESADYIIPLANSPAEELRFYAALFLDRFVQNPQTRPALVKLSQDKSPEVSSSALITLKYVDKKRSSR